MSDCSICVRRDCRLLFFVVSIGYVAVCDRLMK